MRADTSEKKLLQLKSTFNLHKVERTQKRAEASGGTIRRTEENRAKVLAASPSEASALMTNRDLVLLVGDLVEAQTPGSQRHLQEEAGTQRQCGFWSIMRATE